MPPPDPGAPVAPTNLPRLIVMPEIVIGRVIESGVARLIKVTPENVIVPPSHTFVSIPSRRVFGPVLRLLVTTNEFEHGLPTVYESAFEVLVLKAALPFADPSPVYTAVMVCTAVASVEVVQLAEPPAKVSPVLVPLSPAPIHVIGVAPSRN